MANHKNNSNMDPEGSEYFKQAVASKKEIATCSCRLTINIPNICQDAYGQS